MFQRRVFLFLVFHAFTHCVIAASHHPQDFLQKFEIPKMRANKFISISVVLATPARQQFLLVHLD